MHDSQLDIQYRARTESKLKIFSTTTVAFDCEMCPSTGVYVYFIHILYIRKLNVLSIACTTNEYQMQHV